MHVLLEVADQLAPRQHWNVLLLTMRGATEPRAFSVVFFELVLVGLLCLIVGPASTIWEEFQALVEWEVLQGMNLSYLALGNLDPSRVKDVPRSVFHLYI